MVVGLRGIAQSKIPVSFFSYCLVLMWWLHLLVRGRSKGRLRERCELFERLMRALGHPMPYGDERLLPLLLRVSCRISIVQSFTVNEVPHSVCDRPCGVGQLCKWWKRAGKYHRNNGPSSIHVGGDWDCDELTWHDNGEKIGSFEWDDDGKKRKIPVSLWQLLLKVKLP